MHITREGRVLPLVPTTKEITMIERKELSKEDITHLAYGLYLQRGCEPGRDIEDLTRAEQELSSEVVVGPLQERRVREAVRNLSLIHI